MLRKIMTATAAIPENIMNTAIIRPTAVTG